MPQKMKHQKRYDLLVKEHEGSLCLIKRTISYEEYKKLKHIKGLGD